MRVTDILQDLVALAFVLVGAAAARDWLRRRSRSSGYLALALVSLALVSALGRLTVTLPPGAARWIQPVSLALFLISGYGLLAFRHSFIPLRWWVLRGAQIVMAVVLVAAVVLVPVTSGRQASLRAESAPALAATLALLAIWAVCVTEPAIRFWLAGRRLPAVQRARLQSLSFGYLGIVLILLFAIGGAIFAAAEQDAVTIVTQVVALLLCPFLLFSFAPPGWVRRGWRAREEVSLRQATDELLRAHRDIHGLAGASLGWALRLMGSERGFILDHDGSVLAAIGLEEAEALRRGAGISVADGAALIKQNRATAVAVRVPFQDGPGSCVVDSGVYTPFFGSDEMDRLKQYANSVAPALDRLRLIAQLERSQDDLRQAIEDRSDFMNAVVHDLRSPLTVIAGYIEMLEGGAFGDVPADAARPLGIIDSKLEEVRHLVDDLLLCARVESGTLPVEPQQLDLREVAGAAVERARPKALITDATVKVVLPPAPVRATADEELLGRILDNLINNALAYGGSPAEVTVSVIEGDDDGPAVAVADQGPGIEPELRDRIFERFVRGNRREVSGSGLGLYLSRELALRQGGTLKLDDASQGGGARFVVRLPRPASPPEERVA